MACSPERMRLMTCVNELKRTVDEINRTCMAQHAAFKECYRTRADEIRSTGRDVCAPVAREFIDCANLVAPLFDKSIKYKQ